MARLIIKKTATLVFSKLSKIIVKQSEPEGPPQGVRGRNSDNTMIKEVLGWAPSITLEDGLEKTYEWIYNQMQNCKDSDGY